MNNEFMTILLIGGLFLLFGIIFIISNLLIVNNQKEKKERCVSSTIGKVVNIVQSSKGFYLHPVFEYTVNGETINSQSIYGSKERHFFIGQEIKIYYNPLNHHDYFVVEEGDIVKTTTKIFSFLGKLFSFLGIILLIFAMIIK